MTEPTQARGSSAKDFFFHLLGMVTLYASAVSFLVVVFQLVNLGLPDPLTADEFYRYDSARRALRIGLSVLIVMFPVYLGTSWWLQKEYRRHQEKIRLRVRLWLVYLTLFVAALIILVALVTLINTLLEGELTLRFLLKLVSVLFVAGSVFGYYLWDVRRHHLGEV